MAFLVYPWWGKYSRNFFFFWGGRGVVANKVVNAQSHCPNNSGYTFIAAITKWQTYILIPFISHNNFGLPLSKKFCTIKLSNLYLCHQRTGHIILSSRVCQRMKDRGSERRKEALHCLFKVEKIVFGTKYIKISCWLFFH